MARPFKLTATRLGTSLRHTVPAQPDKIDEDGQAEYHDNGHDFQHAVFTLLLRLAKLLENNENNYKIRQIDLPSQNFTYS
jgi:hypothetical protein